MGQWGNGGMGKCATSNWTPPTRLSGYQIIPPVRDAVGY
jgi:hypothetical protein